jgi:hypothetical protein
MPEKAQYLSTTIFSNKYRSCLPQDLGCPQNLGCPQVFGCPQGPRATGPWVLPRAQVPPGPWVPPRAPGAPWPQGPPSRRVCLDRVQAGGRRAPEVGSAASDSRAHYAAPRAATLPGAATARTLRPQECAPPDQARPDCGLAKQVSQGGARWRKVSLETVGPGSCRPADPRRLLIDLKPWPKASTRAATTVRRLLPVSPVRPSAPVRAASWRADCAPGRQSVHQHRASS